MKRIVVCCDGTGAGTANTQPTNVLLMHRATDGFAPGQVSWYDEGVGTGGLLSRLVGGALGRGLTRNVEQAYRYLVAEYEPGDEVFLFGFSRGAFTVRSLVGLVRNAGLLRPDRIGCLAAGMEMYRKETCGPESDTALRFRSRNSIDMPVKFMGVWDTVGSMGIPYRRLSLDRFWLRNYGFHDARLSSMVENACQALAIDEKRSVFKASVWFDPKAQRGSPEKSMESDPGLMERNPDCFAGNRANATRIERPRQTVDQAWFRGCHSDIGGSNVPAGLSNLAFTWVADKARALGLQLDGEFVAENVDPDAVQQVHESRKSFYRFLPAHNRPLATASPETERLHESVVALVEASPQTYRPKNLVTLLESTNRPSQ